MSASTPTPNDLASAALAAFGPGPKPFVYVVTLKSGVSLTRASSRPPTQIMGTILMARAVPRPAIHEDIAIRDSFVRWIDGDGTDADEIADLMYVPPAVPA